MIGIGKFVDDKQDVVCIYYNIVVNGGVVVQVVYCVFLGVVEVEADEIVVGINSWVVGVVVCSVVGIDKVDWYFVIFFVIIVVFFLVKFVQVLWYVKFVVVGYVFFYDFIEVGDGFVVYGIVGLIIVDFVVGNVQGVVGVWVEVVFSENVNLCVYVLLLKIINFGFDVLVFVCYIIIVVIRNSMGQCIGYIIFDEFNQCFWAFFYSQF